MAQPSRQLKTAKRTQLRNGNLNEFIRRTSCIPNQPPPQPPPPKIQKPEPSDDKILDGVIACLDVRTEDGDDVSQNFERALQSMGAKTRRSFSDAITHLVFKNGSAATLKKAIAKDIFIVNLLWVSRCKREGKRCPETDFLIERPQGLLLSANKRRKSMEPGKVKALETVLQPSSSTSSSSSSENEARRKTIGSTWTAKDLYPKKQIAQRAVEAEERSPRLSLPISVESIANRHIKPMKENKIIPVHAPTAHMREQIKARFSIGQKDDEIIGSRATPPIKRKRRLTGTMKSSDANHGTIVFANIHQSMFKKYIHIIHKLDKFRWAPMVDETTTHVIVGSTKRAKAIAMGLVRGCWIMDYRTTYTHSILTRLIESESRGCYVDESEYQLKKWFPCLEVYRKGPFLNNKKIKIESTKSYEIHEMEELVRLAGGCSVNTIEEAEIVLSDKPIETQKQVVSEDWLFNCIEQWQCLTN
ncbi:hypothetical protein BDB01DRAFT_854078 [Pilobolus umbonatus]|nr:hypothetical protein BDB01DRAFT_854078 [Pilobolus umbonatus]